MSLQDMIDEESALQERLAREHQEEIRRANEAVKQALAAYEAQKWYQTAWARFRFACYWVTYKVRETIALAIVRAYCKYTGKDSRLVSQKVWRKLGI